MDRMELTLEIAERKIGAKRINVRSTLQVESLIEEIRNHHSLDGEFQLYIKGERQPLDPTKALDDLGVQPGAVLTCQTVVEQSDTLARISRGVPERFSKKFQRVYLVEERSRLEFDIPWQPAVLGRKDQNNPANNKLLVVDLEDLEEIPTVSRHHACLTEVNGSFWLEGLKKNNPTYLNNERLRVGVRRQVKPGDVIRLGQGQIALSFNLIG